MVATFFSLVLDRRGAVLSRTDGVTELIDHAALAEIRACWAAVAAGGAPRSVTPTGARVTIVHLGSALDDCYLALFERSARDPLGRSAQRFALTSRERDVAALLVGGASRREIADELGIVEATVDFHLRGLHEKAGSRTRTELVARLLGWQDRHPADAYRGAVPSPWPKQVSA